MKSRDNNILKRVVAFVVMLTISVNTIILSCNAMEIRKVENYDVNFESDLNLQGSTMKAMVKGDGKYIAIGERGNIKISTDSITWFGVDSGTSQNLNDIIWTGEYFVIVGDGGTILYSQNGDNWIKPTDTSGMLETIIGGQNTFINYSLTQSLESIAYFNDRYVAGGYYGELWTSNDLIKWQPIENDSVQKLKDEDILLSNSTIHTFETVGNTLVAVLTKMYKGDYIIQSTDGLNWSKVYNNNEEGYIKDITKSSTEYVALISNNKYLISQDGVKWEEKQLSISTDSKTYKIAIDNDIYYVVGQGINNKREYYSGQTLDKLENLNITTEYNFYAQIVDIIVENNSIMWIGYNNNLVRVSNNREVLEEIGSNIGDVTAIDSNNENIVLATTQGLYSGKFNTFEKRLSKPFEEVKYINNKYIAIGSNTIYESKDSIEWVEVTSDYYGINSLTYGNGKYIAVGENGIMISSNDGNTWSNIEFDNNLTLKKVIYNNNEFIAVGYNGIVLKSKDGVKWSKSEIKGNKPNESSYDNPINDIIWDGEKYIAVGELVSVSVDGVNWDKINYVGDPLNLTSIIKHKDIFIATGLFGQLIISKDGYNWEKCDKGQELGLRIVSASNYNNEYVILGGQGSVYKTTIKDNNPEFDYDWVYDQNITRFKLNSIDDNEKIAVAVGNSGHIKISEDGYRWMTVKGETTENLNKVKYINDSFYILGDNGIILKSSNGVDWIKINSKVKNNLNDIVFANGKYVIGGDDGTTITSTDGVNWSIETTISGRSLDIENILYFKDKFIAFGVEFNSRIFISEDAKSWTEIELPYGFIYSYRNVATNGEILIIADNNNLVISKDGVNWEKGNDFTWPYVHYINDKFVVYELNNTYYSVDGYNWNVSSSNMFGFNNPNETTVFKNNVIGVSNNNNGESNIALSKDGLEWEEVQLYVNAQTLNSVEWLGGRFLAGGDRETILTSFSGTDWNKGSIERYSTFLTIAWNGEVYVAGGVLGSVYISKNGDNWYKVELPVIDSYGTWITEIKWLDNEFIAICDSGEIFQSDNGYHWNIIYDLQERLLNTNKVIKFKDKYYCVGLADDNKTTILESSDKRKWTKSKIDIKLNDLAVLEDSVIMIDFDGYIYTSNDMQEWNKTENRFLAPSKFIKTEDNVYIFEKNELLHQSKDGINWSNKFVPNMQYYVNSGASNGNTLVAVGEASSIFTKKIGENNSESRIEINGQSFIKTTSNQQKIKYSSDVYDLNNKKISSDNNLKWTIETSLSNLTINSSTGELTIPANCKNGEVKVKASISDNIYAVKTVQIGQKPDFYLQNNSYTLRVGETTKLKVNSDFGVDEYSVNYSSNNSDTLIDKLGTVEAKNKGQSIINVMRKGSNIQQEVTIKIVEAEDINKDDKIDILDMSKVATLYNTKSTDSNFDRISDFNNDMIIDIFDIIKIAHRL